ncbi:Cell division control protein [Lachnellula suecica]|uniref:Cell division control protein n=1 Tax=Lachnellula suecica TaxID=602035 RepID=A0A8T9C4E3_9HELO|nr:Cell division control protein [Lachnellula suecica]
MEALLSLAFDNLASHAQEKHLKGLRQIDALLAEVCLSSPAPKSTAEKRRSVIDPGKEPPPLKTLGELSSDPGFRAFFMMQDSFEGNIAVRLIALLDKLLGQADSMENERLIMKTLELMQGVLLLHPQSRNLFSKDYIMNQLFDLLEPSWCPATQTFTIAVLVAALLDSPQNIRNFEENDGLLVITSALRSDTTRSVKMKLMEFIYFYLMPETPALPSAKGTASGPSLLQRSPSKLARVAFGRGDTGGRKRADSESLSTRTTEEKQMLLGKHMDKVEDLVADLRDGTPFGGAVQ